MFSNIAQTIIRSSPRRWISIAISLVIVAIAAAALYELLRNVDFGKVVVAIEHQPFHRLAIAGAFVIGGYVVLTFYDVFALRAIGCRNIPYSVAALASFTSSTIGHNLGAAVFTGGLVRLRIYSRWGLTIADVAKIAVITGMIFWLGDAVLLGTALVYAPAAASGVDHLPLWVNRLIGAAGLLAVAGYLVWLLPRPRSIGLSNWRLLLPNLRLTLVQITIGATDLCLVTAAMYTLLPNDAPADFPAVLVIFLTATLVGTVSYAPGNLGVIEAAMLFGLPQFHKEELLAALLTFRVLYFLIPFLFATIMFGLRELRLIAQRAARHHADPDRNLRTETNVRRQPI